jgi:hypothetical protein
VVYLTFCAGSCEHSGEPLGPIKGGEFCELTTSFSRRAPVHWSYLTFSCLAECCFGIGSILRISRLFN